MAKRRAFVPTSPFCSTLEGRIAPANVFGLGSWWDKTVDDLGLRKHHDTSNTDIVENTWKHSKALSAPHPAGHAAHAAHTTNTPSTFTFK